MNKNKGLNLELERQQQDGTEYVFGGLSDPCITDIPEGEREQYLPKGERQDIGEEKMWCVTAAFLNKLEVKFNWLLKNKKLLPENETWLREQGYITENGFEFSDAFIAILSGTTRQGNSLKAPLQAIHEHGLIPKIKLPQLHSFADNYDPDRINGTLLALGQQFLRRFKINYEKVYEVHYKELLKEDMLGVAGFAWPEPVNGVYPRTDSDPNHAFLVYKNGYFAFDNYEESVGDYIKTLAPNYNFLDYGYRIYITAQYIPSIDARFGAIGELLSRLWQLIFPLKEQVENKVVPEINIKPSTMTNEEKLLKISLDSLDVDVSPDDLARDELGCAESVSNIIKKVFPDFPIILSTAELFQKLKADKRFKATLTPHRGCIVVAPRTATVHGHAGIFITEERIASNDSKTGQFKGNYDWVKWITEFIHKRGLRTYLFELIG